MHGGNLPAHYWQPPRSTAGPWWVTAWQPQSSDDDPGLTEPGWYFWDEAELAVGPFPDFASAEEARKNYVP